MGPFTERSVLATMPFALARDRLPLFIVLIAEGTFEKISVSFEAMTLSTF